VRINFWLDEEGRVVQEESPAGFALIAEPEFRAKDLVDSGNELLSLVAVPFRGKLPPEGATSVTYLLRYPSVLDLDLHGGRQSLDNDRLTVSREEVPLRVNSAGGSGCGDPQFLRASRYVQADNDKIISLARSIAGQEKDPAVQVRRLADWVYNNLEKRPVIGLPDALTTLHSRKGDCNEHASLFAALARSLSIPTVIATGVTLQNDAFYYHAWNEICLGGNWYSLDTTTNQMPADLFHIRFGIGDLEGQLKIGGLLGRLTIEILASSDNGHPDS
jgi:transglutaminase-like putative cysteine protease